MRVGEEALYLAWKCCCAFVAFFFVQRLFYVVHVFGYERVIAAGEGFFELVCCYVAFDLG